MEEKIQQSKKIKTQKKYIIVIFALIILILFGGNIYATSQGYGNIFFMIKEIISPSEEVHGKEEILLDRDITISYEPIQITENMQIIISKMQIKENEAKIILLVNQNNIEEKNITPLKYKVYNSNQELLCEQKSVGKYESIYQDELLLKNYSEQDKVLSLEIYDTSDELITTILIDIENREINILGQEEYIEKISEIELKEYLGSISRNSKNSEGTCINISKISYSNGCYTVTYTYCFLEGKSLFDIDIKTVDIYECTVGIKLDESGTKFDVFSMDEPIIVQKGEKNEEVEEFPAPWLDFEGTYALKTTLKNGEEINPKKWNSWDNNNWLVFYNDGTFKDTLLSKIFSSNLTDNGKYRFKEDEVILNYSNGQTIILIPNKEMCEFGVNMNGYDITIMGYAHRDLLKYDAKFVGAWKLEYGIDLNGNIVDKKVIYEKQIYGTDVQVHLALDQGGNVEYTICGNEKVVRGVGDWINDETIENRIKVVLANGTEVYADYYEKDQYGKKCIKFQFIENKEYSECYYVDDEIIVEKKDNIYGDVNCDGIVSNEDEIYLSKYLANEEGYDLTEEGKINADVNCDSQINLKDKTILTRYLANWEGYEFLPYNG